MQLDIWRIMTPLSGTVEDATNIIDLGKVGQEGHEVGQLGVVGVVKPGGNGDSIVRVEDVRCRRVIQDDGITYWTAKLR